MHLSSDLRIEHASFNSHAALGGGCAGGEESEV